MYIFEMSFVWGGHSLIDTWLLGLVVPLFVTILKAHGQTLDEELETNAMLFSVVHAYEVLFKSF